MSYRLDFYRVAWPHLDFNEFGHSAVEGHLAGVYPGPYSQMWHNNPRVNLGITGGRVPGSYILNHHPVPYEDGIEDIRDEEFCGFQALGQVNSWFAPWFDSLEENGYRILHYLVEYRRDGFRQSVAPLVGIQPVGIHSMYWKGQ